MGNDRQGVVLSPKGLQDIKTLQRNPDEERSIIHTFQNPLQSKRQLTIYHRLHKLAMLLLQFLSLALLASKHVAGIPTEAGFRLTVRDDCGVDGNLTKRAPCTQPVQCGSTHHSIRFIATVINDTHSR